MRRIKVWKRISVLIVACLVIAFWGDINCNAANKVYIETEDINNSSETGSYLLEDCAVDVEINSVCDDEYILLFTITNTVSLNVSDWSVVFEAEYSICSFSDVTITENNQIKHIDCKEDNAYISSGDSISFEILVTYNDRIDKETIYRVYGNYDTNEIYDGIDEVEFKENVDVIKHNLETGEYTLDIMDADEVLQSYRGDMETEANGIFLNDIDFAEEYAETYSIIGDDAREKVTNVTSVPYSGIALLVVTDNNGVTKKGTGFVIGDKYLATAAHVVYQARSVEAYFGVNGIYFTHCYNATELMCCSGYSPTSISVNNDWAVVKLEENVHSSIGRFLIGYTTYDYQLYTMNYTVCGYPGDMYVSNPNGICGYEIYMYKHFSPLHSFTDDVLFYTADTSAGQSGSPVYNTHTNTVYAIHNGGDGEKNCGRRFTETLYAYFRAEGFID